MLKELIEGSFYLTFPVRSGVVVCVTENTYCGLFTLRDEKACGACPLCINDSDQRESIRINTSSTVSVVSITDIVSPLKESVGELCDYLLANETYVVFLEMTCSASQYVNAYEVGKRSKAKSQLNNTILTLSVNPYISAFFLKRENKFAVFSWKDTSKPRDYRDEVERGFGAFTEFADVVYSEENVQVIANDFLMKEIRYPNILRL